MAIRFWDLTTGQDYGEIPRDSGGVTSLAFTPNGLAMASASEDTTVRLWGVSSRTALRRFEGHEGGIKCVTFSPDAGSEGVTGPAREKKGPLSSRTRC